MRDSLIQSLRRWPYHWAGAGFFILLGIVFYGPHLTDMPSGIHSWAQSDRLALAMMYYDYGFDFFKPRTYSLASIGGITGVEFPLQAYLAALGGLLVGRGNILVIFRLLDASAVILGCYYLFRLVYERTSSVLMALVPGVFLVSMPTFGFYAVSTLPDPFSLSLTLVAYYYWLRFFDHRHFGDLRLALLVAGVAALVKTTSALHLGALLGITLLWGFLQPSLLAGKERRQFLLLALLTVGSIGFFIFYNRYLNTTYRSELFLATVMPIETEDTLHDVIFYFRRDWWGEYATLTHYRVLLGCLVLVVVFSWRSIRRYLPLLLLLLAATAISGLFWKLMGSQLGAHDYYIICSMLPPALLLLVLTLLHLGQFTDRRVRLGLHLGFSVLLFFLAVNGYKRLNKRMSDDYPPFSPYGLDWLRGGAQELAQGQVPATARLLVLDESAPNTALVYFDRQGIHWHPASLATVTAAEVQREMAGHALDYVVMSPATYAAAPALQAGLLQDFELVGRQPAWVFRSRTPLHVW